MTENKTILCRINPDKIRLVLGDHNKSFINDNKEEEETYAMHYNLGSIQTESDWFLATTTDVITRHISNKD